MLNQLGTIRIGLQYIKGVKKSTMNPSGLEHDSPFGQRIPEKAMKGASPSCFTKYVHDLS